jgi:acyl carrier protein
MEERHLMDIRDTLLDIFKTLEFDPNEIKDSTRLRTDLEVDSTELAEIAVAIEQRLPVIVDDSTFQKLATFGDVIKYIESTSYHA